MTPNKIILITSITAAVIAFKAAEPAANYIFDNLENQRITERNYNCELYGEEMNQFYNEEVCEYSALYK